MSLARAQVPQSVAADRSRLAEITGRRADTTPPVHLGRLLPAPARARRVLEAFTVVSPEIRFTYNSAIPYSLNDGSLWAGRGKNALLSGGISFNADSKPLQLQITLAPAVSFSENRTFDVLPGRTPGRSNYANPFHGPAASADLPLRFGDRYLLRVDPGRSEVALHAERLRLGVTARSEEWGPGIRNQIVMSANAPGIPRVFVSTARPVRTKWGSLSGEFIAGTLTESLFFDTIATNNYRSLSGVVATFRPAADSMLTLGFERVVYRPVSGAFAALGHGLDVVTSWNYLTSRADTFPNGAARQKSDQIAALFARWIFPDVGFEIYGEWARVDLPRSISELLVAPQHTGGFTLGLQWAQPRRDADYLRLQTEVTSLEQSTVFPGRPPLDYYAGRISSQGYTNRGQVIGASIGPGGSSQWIAVDYFWPRQQIGLYIGRIRWENDALYREVFPTPFKHDVTALVGSRGVLRTKWTDFSADVAYAYRFNFLFQNGFTNPGKFRTIDVRNLTLMLNATPR